MARMKEKELFIDFLENYSEEAIEHGISFYEGNKDGIVVTKISGVTYTLRVRSESVPSKFYDVKIYPLADDELDDSCTCEAMKRFGSCKHGAAAAMYILTGYMP